MEITFLGAAGTVTGSRYLARTGGRTVLVDCGLFQGDRDLRARNREPFPADARRIDAVVLTHAHLDHTGYLPALVRQGFRGPVHCTAATADLCAVILRDSAKLQEEEAEYAARKGWSRHHPPLPLYTAADAAAALEMLRPAPIHAPVDLGGGAEAAFVPAGHILGAASVRLATAEGTLVFSGDLGTKDPILPPSSHPGDADWLLVESTYGDRLHGDADPADELGEVIARTAARGGAVLIPAFAVGRAQTMLHLVARLRAEGRIPEVPVYVDSPMAEDAMDVFRRHPEAHLLSHDEVDALARAARVVRTPGESRRVTLAGYPRVIVSASGMLEGGRILHHLKALGPDPKNTLLFAGFQAPGTRGARILEGAPTVRVHGETVEIRCEVQLLETLSAHADQGELLAWMGRFSRPPRRTFITHGEPAAAAALRAEIESRLGWTCAIPSHGETVVLG